MLKEKIAMAKKKLKKEAEVKQIVVKEEESEVQVVSVDAMIDDAKGKTTSENYQSYIRKAIKRGHL